MYYVIEWEEGKPKRYAHGVGLGPWPKEKISCPVCGREWKKNLIQEYGIEDPIFLTNNNYPDFLYYYILHISQKAASIIESEEITGYSLEKAQIISNGEFTDEQLKVFKRDGVKIKSIPFDKPEYFKLHISGAAIVHEDADYFLSESCDACGYECYELKAGKSYLSRRFVVKKESITETDLFQCKAFGDNIFCTERFVDTYKRYSLTGLIFKPIEAR